MRSVSGAAVGHHPHEVHAAARGVVLVAQLAIGRTGGGTQAAMHAAQQQLRVEAGYRLAVALGGGRECSRAASQCLVATRA